MATAHVGATPTRPRVVLADDHRDVLEEMATLLAPDFEVVRSVSEGVALIAAARDLRPDIVITDINMPGLNGIDAGRKILQQGLCGAVIVLSVYNEPQLVRKAIDAGMSGFILKSDAGEEMVPAIVCVLAGQTYLSRHVSHT